MTAGSIKKYFPGYIFLPLTLAAAIAVVRFWPDQETVESRAPIVAQEAQDQRLQFWEAYRQATKHRVAGRPQEAIADYQKALALRNNHEDALYYLGNMYVNQGYFAGAESVWVRLVGINPYSSRAHAQLGKLYLTPGALFDTDAAENEFQRSLEINSEETGPFLNLGRVALVRGDLSGAQGYFEIVTASNPASVEAHYLAGYIEWKRGNMKNALILLRKAVEFSRPRAPEKDATEEGDTKTGRTLGSQNDPGRMELFRMHLTVLPTLDNSDLPRQMTGRYEALDTFIEKLGE